MSSSNKFSQGDSRSIDHISIVSKAEERHISVVDKLQADIDAITKLFKDTKQSMQARIDELNDLLSKVDAERKLRGLKIIELQTKLHKLEAKR